MRWFRHSDGAGVLVAELDEHLAPVRTLHMDVRRPVLARWRIDVHLEPATAVDASHAST
jgi:hypothetical protein